MAKAFDTIQEVLDKNEDFPITRIDFIDREGDYCGEQPYHSRLPPLQATLLFTDGLTLTLHIADYQFLALSCPEIRRAISPY